MVEPTSNDSSWHIESQYRICIRDLRVPAFIGIHEREYQYKQAIRIDLQLIVDRPDTPTIANILNYDEIVAGLRRIISARHHPLLENLGEELLALCMAKPMVNQARITVEKLEVDSMAAGIGVTVTANREK